MSRRHRCNALITEWRLTLRVEWPVCSGLLTAARGSKMSHVLQCSDYRVAANGEWGKLCVVVMHRQ